MSVNVLILNTAVVDFRGNQFSFVKTLVGPGGLAKCNTADMPAYTRQQYKDWFDKGFVTGGGSANTAPLIARAGIKVAIGANLGGGDFDGLDAPGRFFHDTMTANNVDMSAIFIHPDLPTGTTFIYDSENNQRGGLAYFPNANNDFDFEFFKGAVERLKPEILYYMYSGISDRGDANGGRDLADFLKWCRQQGCITLVDSATLAADPEESAKQRKSVEGYKLLAPVLPELDLFFTSSDEIKMILNTLDKPRRWDQSDEDMNIRDGLNLLTDRFWDSGERTRIFGVTVKDGAYERHIGPDGSKTKPTKTESKFMTGDIVDLTGAGDSFRAGFVSYIAKNIEAFSTGSMDFSQAIQMGNLFAALYIKAPLNDRYGNIKEYKKMLNVVKTEF